MTQIPTEATLARMPASDDDPADLAPALGDGAADTVLAGGGELGALMRAFDWSATPLGRVETWPQSLRTPVRILLTSRFAMWMGWGPELTFLYNDAYGQMTLGKKHPWALGRPAREVWAEIWRDIGPRIEQVLATGAATWDESLLLFLERSGYPEETYHTFSYSPLADDAGRVAGMLCVVTEETERVIGERRLASLRELASDLAATTRENDVLMAVGRRLGENQKDLPFTLTYLFEDGGRRARLACRTGISADHPAAVPILTAESADEPWPMSVMALGAAAVGIDLAGRLTPLPAGAWDRPPANAVVVPIAQPGHERPAGFLVSGLNPYRVFDASYSGFVRLVAGQIGASLANARVYEEERRRAAALAELDRAKTAFFSNVSHEFRTPITLLLGPSEDALNDTTTSPETRERLEVIHRNALRLLKLVNTLLDFSRIEAGRVDALFEPTDLAAYTAELASTFRAATERENLTLTVDCPPLGEPVYVDRGMWEKIVLNLISNAYKHTFDGGIAVRLRVVAGRATLDVSDTGVGIARNQLSRIFDRFHRVPNVRSRTNEGTGIGLSLVQELARLHQGFVSVESVEGEGSRFTVSIPLGRDHLPDDHTVPDGADRRASTVIGAAPFVEEALRWSRPSAGNGTHAEGDVALQDARLERSAASSRGRVVLADDNADMRDYVTRLLTNDGYDVEPVGDGAAALAAARTVRPDVILSDVMMPHMDGAQLLAAVRGDAALHDVPVLLLSARAAEESRIEGLHAGADDYLVKPFSARELLARVGVHVRASRERVAAAAARTAAEEASRAKTQFLAIMSHELRTPLNAIAGYTDLIALGVRGPVTEEQRADLERIRRNQRHLLALINDVLNLARVEAGQLHFDIGDVRIAHVLASAEPLIAPQVAAKGLHYRYIPCDATLLVRADAERVSQVLANLLGNAVKFTDRGGTVTVSCEVVDEQVAIRVTDTGRGIPADKQEEIFEPFVQVARGHSVDEGTGLGLAISRDLAQHMGGGVTVESTPGQGSTFTLWLPHAASEPSR